MNSYEDPALSVECDLRAEVERLTRELGETNEALAACQSQAAGEIRHLRTMLKTVGDDYPGSSLQEWIYEILGLPSPSATLLEKFRQETSNGTSR